MWLVVVWMVTSIIAKLQHKETVTLYGSRLHNRVKPLMVALVTIPFVMQDIYIDINIYSTGLLGVMAACVIAYSVINNKMLETVPMYIMQTTIILIYIETSIIDMMLGVVPIEFMVLLSIAIKVLGTYYLVREVGTKSDNKRVYVIIFLLSIIVIVRMYAVSELMARGYISKGLLVIITQLSIFIYANIRYRKEKIRVTKEIVIKYIPQVVLTMVNDLIYIVMITRGVSGTVDIDILCIILVMLVETKLKVTKNKWLGIAIIGVGWLIYLV